MSRAGILADHFPLLLLLAALLAAFLALLWRDAPRERLSFFVRVFLALSAGAVAAGWLLLAAGRPAGAP